MAAALLNPWTQTAAYPAGAAAAVRRGSTPATAGIASAASTAWPVGVVAALALLTLGVAAKVAGGPRAAR